MGTMQYGGEKLYFEDRVLAHLEVVIVLKLRAGESFLMSWVKDVAIGSGRTSVWLHPTMLLRFDFLGSRVPTINRDWLQRLHDSANSPKGLIVTNEDGSLARCGAPH